MVDQKKGRHSAVTQSDASSFSYHRRGFAQAARQHDPLPQHFSPPRVTLCVCVFVFVYVRIRESRAHARVLAKA